MGKYQKILVALDGSSACYNALKQAIKLASEQKGGILGIYVAPRFIGDLDLTGIKDIESVIKGPAEEITARAQAIAKEERGLTVRVITEQGEPYERILDAAEAEGCDLIVLGSKDYSAVERGTKQVLGRTLTRVIGYSRIDVLVVPENTSMHWSSILLATDGSAYSEIATKKAIAFAMAYGERLKVIAVVNTSDEFMTIAPKLQQAMVETAQKLVRDTAQKAKDAGCEADTFVMEGDTAQIITELAQKEGVDAIIMGSHGRTGIRRLLMGSVTEGVINLSPCPVLVVKT